MKLVSVFIFVFVSLANNQFQQVSARSLSSSCHHDPRPLYDYEISPNSGRGRGVNSEPIYEYDRPPWADYQRRVKRSETTSLRGDLVGRNNKVQGGKTRKNIARSGSSEENSGEKFELIKKRIIATINNILAHETKIVDQIVEGESKAEFLELRELFDQLAIDFLELSPLLKTEFLDGPVVLLRDFIDKFLEPLIEIDEKVEPEEGKIVEFLKTSIPGVKGLLPLIAGVIPSFQESFNKAVGGEYPASSVA